MSRSTFFLLGSLMLLFSCSAAHGQGGCGTSFQPHFNVYKSISRDGKHIFTSVTTEGWTNITGSCNMSGAMHKARAYNQLAGTGGWNDSAWSCPTCSFYLINNQTIDGEPGSTYLWCSDGSSVCNIVGTFWDAGTYCPSIPGCLAPSTETTAVEAAVFTTETAFNQTIGDSAGDSFNGSTVTEGNAAPGQDTCWGTWSTGPRFTGVTGGSWTVAGGQVVGQPNHWGFDYVGWTTTAVDYYRVQAPAHGVALPCGLTGFQSLTISCPSGSVIYTPSVGNKLTATIEQTDVINCRYDMNNSACQTINY